MKQAILGFVVGIVCTVTLLVVASSRSPMMSPLSVSEAVQLEPTQADQKNLELFGTGPGGGGKAKEESSMEDRGLGRVMGNLMVAPPAVQAMPASMAAEEESALVSMDEGGTATAPTRSWFPETFLFEPLVVTNEEGEATVPVRVPDRLTRWRVLALAHSRTGEQAGAVASFQGTLPVYVEPVLPGFLVAGDELRLPLQVVNTTGQAVGGGLKFSVEGARLAEDPSGPVQVPAQGSVLRHAVLRAERPGTAVVRASYGSEDALVKELQVVPAGRPVSASSGGTLAAPRELELSPPPDAVPGTTRVRLTVFPGALSVLRQELGAAALRGSAEDDAYGLLLAGRAEGLLRNLGEEVDREALRRATLVLQQRALRHTRAAQGPTAALFAEAALAHPENPVLSRLGERLAQTVAATQRPDGTFQGSDGWRLQRLLVATAEGTRAVAAGSDAVRSATGSGALSAEARARHQRAMAAKVRASGAFERYLSQITDGYTAAAILASGAASGTVAQQLQERVVGALVKHADGSRSLSVEEGVTRSNGQRPTEAEATALAILALADDPKAPVADLGAFLLGRYSPVFGWGDGRTNLVALQAVLHVFRAPLPAQVRVVLERDGRVVTEGTISAASSREVVSMEAAAPAQLGAAGKWTVRAEPAVPGLGYRLELASWVPWKQETAGGLELSVVRPDRLKVGEAGLILVSAAGPAGTSWSLRTALPAGVQVDRPSLEEQKQRGLLLDYALEDGAVTLRVPPRTAGQPFSTTLKVIPTLGGRLHAGASSLQVEDRPEWTAYAPTEAWTIRP